MIWIVCHAHHKSEIVTWQSPSCYYTCTSLSRHQRIFVDLSLAPITKMNFQLNKVLGYLFFPYFQGSFLEIIIKDERARLPYLLH